MKHLLIILISFLLLSFPVIGQSERPETIIIPVSSMGDVSDTRKQILENTLTDELKKHFRIVPQEKYEQVLYTFGKMEPSIWVNGRMGKNMVKEQTLTVMEGSM